MTTNNGIVCGAGLTTSVILHLVLPPYLDRDRVPVQRVAASRRDLVEESGGVWEECGRSAQVHSRFAARELQSINCWFQKLCIRFIVSLYSGILFSLAAGSSPQLSALDLTLHCLSHDKVSKPTTASCTEPHGSTISPLCSGTTTMHLSLPRRQTKRRRKSGAATVEAGNPSRKTNDLLYA
ncbi:hypothetical protein GGR55DRAFT_627508 [Xylaria sp. FL0064]|nr:hypothetical protein GGR55DRAFT_627508 [Xylaria sp. FL0064]